METGQSQHAGRNLLSLSLWSKANLAKSASRDEVLEVVKLFSSHPTPTHWLPWFKTRKPEPLNQLWDVFKGLRNVSNE